MTAPDISALIRRYGLQAHPEGGYYARSYCSAGRIAAAALPKAFGGDRAYASAIVYLLPAGERSRLHRLRQDELWHFYLGGPLRLVGISPDGVLTESILGPDVLAGQDVQRLTPAGHWFGAAPMPGSPYSFVGCTVSPEFTYDDFEMAERETLLRLFPHLAEIIADFT